eukprot:TRINITY_DN5082_c0_g1_i1.p1 TRINITY_DN5082_c0_g1~~TRINITY_DN5082_c0_g1_i1.p1  ORF type:complete len:692 (-),score=204.59 TRINITY_DN5082_c0_g1_i1:132-2207(-)
MFFWRKSKKNEENREASSQSDLEDEEEEIYRSKGADSESESLSYSFPLISASSGIETHPDNLNNLLLDVLRYQCIKLSISHEFLITFGPSSPTLTSFPLDSIEKYSKVVELHSKELKERVKGPKSFPPLLRAFYSRWIKGLPVFSGQGDEYLEKGEIFIDNHAVPFLFKLQRATKFDLLNFLSHYLTLLGHIKNIAWYGVDDKPLPSPFSKPIYSLPTSLLPSLIAHHRSVQNGGGSFLLYRRFQRQEKGTERIAVEELRREKAKGFAGAWQDAFSMGCQIIREEISDYKGENPSEFFVDRLWKMLRERKEKKDLPELWRSFLDAALRAIAHTVDNVLDNKNWRNKFKTIWKGMPLDLVLTALRLVNPIPFMDQMIKLFSWRPPGMYSLLQRFGLILCGLEKTSKALEKIKSQIHNKHRTKEIEKIVDLIFKTPLDVTQNRLSTMDPLEKIRQFLIQSGMEEVIESELDYCVLYLRQKEKEEFVNALGETEVIDFIKHVAKVIPPILSEVWKCYNFAQLMTELVHTITQTLEVLSAYDSCHSASEHSKVHPKVIEGMTQKFDVFLDSLYSVAHNLSKQERAGPGGIHAVVDYLYREFIRPHGSFDPNDESDTDRDSLFETGLDSRCVLNQLNEEERKRLLREVEMVLERMRTSRDFGECEMELLNGQSCGIYSAWLTGQCVGGSVKDLTPK